jgi:hypothetical protein
MLCCGLYLKMSVDINYNDQHNVQMFNLFIYLLLPYMFRAFFLPIFRGGYTTWAVVHVTWVWGPHAQPT